MEHGEDKSTHKAHTTHHACWNQLSRSPEAVNVLSGEWDEDDSETLHNYCETLMKTSQLPKLPTNVSIKVYCSTTALFLSPLPF